MKRILVTGAGGYIGRHIVSSLLDMGADVIAVDFNIDKIDERADRRIVDIFSGDEDLYEKLGKPEVCLHMAWKDGFVHGSDAHMEMLSSHYAFIKYLVKNGTKQIAVMGTMHEVGYHEGEINDDTPCNPISLYGIAKDALRRSLMLLAERELLREALKDRDNERFHLITGQDILVKPLNELFDFFDYADVRDKEFLKYNNYPGGWDSKGKKFYIYRLHDLFDCRDNNRIHYINSVFRDFQIAIGIRRREIPFSLTAGTGSISMISSIWRR